MQPEAAKRLRLLASSVSVLVVLAIIAGVWFYSRLRASLPQLDGQAAVGGLGAAVTVERDALGVPTIRGQSRPDVARALGWLHAQDRFFQMDLLRRSAAGELAEVFGKRALPRDRANRMHGFRARAQQTVAQLPADQRALLDAYTAGVNAGLASLREKPFEYLVIRETPQPWRPEDTLLVGYAMTLDMQDEVGSYEKTLMTLRDQLGLDGLAFFSPLVGPDDAALDNSRADLAPIPGPKVLNLRTQKVGRHLAPKAARDPNLIPGSNAFALSGAHTANGAALVADDMHLDHAVPNTWYRASLEYPDHKITGITLPGIPLIIAGSNGHVAWGFTNACIDTGDLVVVELAPGLTTWYSAPGDKTLEIEQRKETIAVKGERAAEVEYPWTIWGPIVGKNESGRPLARRWVAHDLGAINLTLGEMENASDVAAAIDVAHRAGMPAQNIVIADASGAIAWTIAGGIPKRIGYDGRLPASWAFGDRRWEGHLPPDEVPTVIQRPAADSGNGAADAKTGRIWSANQRHVGGDALVKLGDDGYRPPPRAAQIRDDLAALEHATPRDLLKVQLDDRAVFLTPWHKLLMDTLSPTATQQKKPRAALRSFAEKWEGRASIEAVSYPIVRQFRRAVYERIFDPIFASCLDANPDFNWHDLYLEPALWRLLRDKPAHLLDARFTTWDDLLIAAADDTIAFLDKQAITLPEANWGLRNTVQIRHPFSYSLPEWATNWLNMPAERLPGDTDMPRVQAPQHGASERFVVAPGHEAEGIFHMPCGQSGHPLSPYYRAGHEAWAHGEPTPFLPGKTEHTLTLSPR
jgi:penicillin amidase